MDESGANGFLPEAFQRWFATRGWTPRQHQLDLLKNAEAGKSALLIAPTGAGKTLAGFLPSLVSLSRRTKRKLGQRPSGIHTLYISPLKALAVDIERNLAKPVVEMGLPITIETRTGDTPVHKRQRQKLVPPDILLTTPEQLALLCRRAMQKSFFCGFEVRCPGRIAFTRHFQTWTFAVARSCPSQHALSRHDCDRPVGNGS